MIRNISEIKQIVEQTVKPPDIRIGISGFDILLGFSLGLGIELLSRYKKDRGICGAGILAGIITIIGGVVVSKTGIDPELGKILVELGVSDLVGIAVGFLGSAINNRREKIN